MTAPGRPGSLRDITLAAPLNAVFSTAESARYVFLRKGEGFVAHAVEIGIADTRNVQIVSGLQVGDEVARSRPLEFEGELPVATLPTAPKPRSNKSPEGKSSDGKSGPGSGKTPPTAKSNRVS